MDLDQRVKKMTDKQLLDGVANYCNYPFTLQQREKLDPFVDVARKEIERRQKEKMNE